MCRPLTVRSVAQPLLRVAGGAAPRSRAGAVGDVRWLWQTSARRADDQEPVGTRPRADDAGQTRPRTSTESLLDSMYGAPQAQQQQQQQQQRQSTMSELSQQRIAQAFNQSNVDTSVLSSGRPAEPQQKRPDEVEPFHLHIYAHKHNTHITFTRPNREPVISLSCGNIGFKKARRGEFDSAYSLTKYVLERLVHAGWQLKISRLELVLRGFGSGREAAVKVLMSPDGKIFRDKIIRVADSTRIKFAGTKSKNPRRL